MSTKVNSMASTKLNSTAEKGGYDVEFVDKEPNDVTCCICLLVLKEPMQAEECGHRFCKSCAEDLRISETWSIICPEDRRKTNMFPDKGKEREILNMLVKCTNNGVGCSWTNELRELQDHLEICEYEIISCFNEECKGSFQRICLLIHLQSECLFRMVTCPFCSVQHLLIEKELHDTACDNYPTQCQECGQKDIIRIKMEKHIEEDCPKTLHPCQFTDVGCQQKLTGEEMVKHLSVSTEIHLQYANNKIQEQSNQINLLLERFTEQTTLVSKLEKSSKAQQATINKLEKQLAVNSQKLEVSQAQQRKFSDLVIWEVPNFNKKFQGVKKGNNTLFRYMFALEGYKLKVDFFLNGNDRDNREHASIFIGTVPGPFDDTLKWPMKAEIIFSVMKREQELNIETIQTDYSNASKKSFQKPPNKVEFWGVGKFIDHKQIRNYIVDDKLTLKIAVKPR